MLKVKEITKTLFYEKKQIRDKKIITKNICSLFDFDEFKEKIITEFRGYNYEIQQKEKGNIFIIKGTLIKKYTTGNKLKIQKIYKIIK